AAASEATSPSSEISLSDPSYDAKPTVSDETVSITFVLGTGAKETRQTVDVKLGDRLLEVAQKLNIPSIDGVCGGNMECATCHVIVDQKHFDVLPRASDGEEVMLEYAIGRVDCSRLACQLKASKEMDGMELRIHSTTPDTFSI
ncbi:hypothetical protein HDU80_002213, partial [Chytriomyces hyalinus]